MISTKIAKINLVLNGDYNSSYCWSNRIHIMIGSGGFSIVENIEGLSEHYADNKHCVYYNSKKDLIKKINYWLLNQNTQKREKIRLDGFYHAHEKNAYSIRTNLFINTIKKNINE